MSAHSPPDRTRPEPDPLKRRFILTAPAGTAGTQMLWLEAAGEVAGEVSVDPGRAFVANLDISERALPPR